MLIIIHSPNFNSSCYPLISVLRHIPLQFYNCTDTLIHTVNHHTLNPKSCLSWLVSYSTKLVSFLFLQKGSSTASLEYHL